MNEETTGRRRWIWLSLLLAGLGVALYLLLGPTAASEDRRSKARKGASATRDSGSEGDTIRGGRRGAARSALAVRERLGVRRLYGQVTDQDGKPVPGATLRLILPGAADVRGTSGADGRYAMLFFASGNAKLEVSAPGHRTDTFARSPLPPGDRVRWDVQIERAPGVYGTVYYRGDPAPGARVQLRNAGEKELLVEQRSDKYGRFSLPALGRAPWQVSALHIEHGGVHITVDEPGEVEIHLRGGGFVEGQVVDARGAPIPAFTVSVTGFARWRGGPGAVTFEDPQGRFRLGPVAAGTRDLNVIADGYQPGRVPNLGFHGGKTLRGIRVVLRRSATVSGRVTDAMTGLPINGALVMPDEYATGDLIEVAAARTGPDGRYRLDHVSAKRSSMTVRALGYRTLVTGGVAGEPGALVNRDFELTPDWSNDAAKEMMGIGASLRRTKSGALEVASIVAGGPAASMLREGDIIVRIGDLDASKASMIRLIQAVRGGAGSDVELWVRRGGIGKAVRTVITRARVVLPR